MAKIHIKNSLMVAPLSVTPTLYMADGTPYSLPPVEVPMSGEVTVNLNQALANAPSWLGGHVSGYGSASLTYMWDGPGHISAAMNMKDVVHSLTFHQPFLAAPASMASPSMAGLDGYARWQQERERAVLASYHPPTPTTRRNEGEAPAAPLGGLWWKRDPGVVGYFALANTSSAPVEVRYRVTGSAGADAGGAAIGLGAYETAAVGLSPLIAALPPQQRDGGGIIVEQISGPAMAVFASGWLENELEGFSASIEFGPGYPAEPMDPGASGSGSAPQPGPVTLAAAGLMLGKPMAGAGFPGEVRFRPYGYLRNATRHALMVTVTADVAMGTMGTSGPQPGPQSFRALLAPGGLVPVALAPLARRVERIMGLDPDSIEGAMLNWSVSYKGFAGDLLVTTGSTDQSGNYVFEVLAQREGPSVGMQLPYWNTASGNDTMYSLWNPGATTQNVVLTLYSADGMHSYAAPVTLAPGASAMVDVGMLRHAGTPDASGGLLPPEVLDGSAMLEPAGALQPDSSGRIKLPASGPAEMHVVVSVGIFNAAEATCCSQCVYCCFYTCPLVTAGLVNVGGTMNATFNMEDCCGFEDDFTAGSSWESYNSSILDYAGPGAFSAVGVGRPSFSQAPASRAGRPAAPTAPAGVRRGIWEAPPARP